MPERIAVIGAGLAGLAIARRLAKAGASVTAFEKAAAIGGRLADVTTPAGVFDIGAQYVSARGTAFRAFLARAEALGKAAVWRPERKDRADDWHVGVPGMAGLIAPLADGFAIETGVEITAIAELPGEGGPRRFQLATGEGETEGPFDRVVVAAPPAAAGPLLAPLGAPFDRISDATAGPCWALLLAFDTRLESVPDLYRRPETQIPWLARNSSKPQRSGETWVAHASTGWSRSHLALEPAAAVAELLPLVAGVLGSLPSPTFADARLWREAVVERELGDSYLLSDDNRLAAIGDWCIASRAEAAFMSAEALAGVLAPLVEAAT